MRITKIKSVSFLIGIDISHLIGSRVGDVGSRVGDVD